MKGFTYIELILTVLLVSLIICSMVTIFSGGTDVGRRYMEKRVALCLAQGLMEETLSKGFDDIVSAKQIFRNKLGEFYGGIRADYVNKGDFSKVEKISTDYKKITVNVIDPDSNKLELVTVVNRPLCTTPS